VSSGHQGQRPWLKEESSLRTWLLAIARHKVEVAALSVLQKLMHRIRTLMATSCIDKP
jgi:hypothetical protein